VLKQHPKFKPRKLNAFLYHLPFSRLKTVQRKLNQKTYKTIVAIGKNQHYPAEIKMDKMPFLTPQAAR